MWEVYPGGVQQPWNQVVFPPAESNWIVNGGLTAARVKAIPSIGRGLALICGMAAQMPLEDMKGDVVQSRPRLLEAPDPDRPRSWFIDRTVDDYLVHGNAIAYTTTRDAEGWPATSMWIPAHWVSLVPHPDTGELEYWSNGRRLRTVDVVHVRRGADPYNPARGLGVVEQYLHPLARLLDQERYESNMLNGSAVPSVAVVTPNADLDQTEADAAKESWMAKYSGPVREPAILPAGTQVIPLAWSPSDAQMVEAQKMGRTDAANMLNLDGYWLGAESGSYTYKSPGPMYLNLIRQTVGPILEDVEGTWSAAWLPRGRRVTFTRRAVQGDDMETTARWVADLLAGGLITLSEARVFLGFGAAVPAELNKPAPTPPPPEFTEERVSA